MELHDVDLPELSQTTADQSRKIIGEAACNAKIRNSLYKLARQYTHNNNGDVQDLVQDTFARALTFAHKFEQGTNITAWLCEILTRLFMNDYRRKKMMSRHASAIDPREMHELFNGSRGMAHPETQLEASLCDEVVEALDNVPPNRIEPFLLFALQDHSYMEIRALLGGVSPFKLFGFVFLEQELN
ncbi:MAG: sigma-70 family RNA polymerase sigma factor [Patescibacteria group bacterium]